VKRHCGAKPGSLLKTEIPLCTGFWDVHCPGYLEEADSVAHCCVSGHIVHQKQNQLASNTREFFGDNILAKIASVPGWKNGLMATRGRHAAGH